MHLKGKVTVQLWDLNFWSERVMMYTQRQPLLFNGKTHIPSVSDNKSEREKADGRYLPFSRCYFVDKAIVIEKRPLPRIISAWGVVDVDIL